jgi:hypothetical protein
MTFHNNLTAIPTTSDFTVYQRLAESGKLFFYDDHLQVISIVVSPSQDRPGFFGLTLNRDNGTVTATYYKYLGRAFLTHPDNLDVVELTDFEVERIGYLKKYWVMPMVPATSMHPAVHDRLDEIEELLEANMPKISKI